MASPEQPRAVEVTTPAEDAPVSQGPVAAPAATTVPDVELTNRRGFGGNIFDNTNEQLLDLPILLEALVEDGFIGQRQAEDILIAPRTKKELNMHPLEIIAGKELENRNESGNL